MCLPNLPFSVVVTQCIRIEPRWPLPGKHAYLHNGSCSHEVWLLTVHLCLVLVRRWCNLCRVVFLWEKTKPKNWKIMKRKFSFHAVAWGYCLMIDTPGFIVPQCRVPGDNVPFHNGLCCVAVNSVCVWNWCSGNYEAVDWHLGLHLAFLNVFVFPLLHCPSKCFTQKMIILINNVIM